MDVVTELILQALDHCLLFSLKRGWGGRLLRCTPWGWAAPWMLVGIGHQIAPARLA